METITLESLHRMVRHVVRHKPPSLSHYDLVSVAGEAAVLAVQSYDGSGTLRGWIYTKVKYALLEAIRQADKQKEREVLVDGIESSYVARLHIPVDEEATDAAYRADVRAAVRTLPNNAIALALMEPGGLSALAQREGVTPGAVTHWKQKRMPFIRRHFHRFVVSE